VRGWWIVGPGGSAGEPHEPTRREGTAWFFSDDMLRAVWLDGNDRRVITSMSSSAAVLKLAFDGGAVLLAATADGLTLRTDEDDPAVRLRRATAAEIKDIERRVGKQEKMNERACQKAMECCQAARKNGLATAEDCNALIGVPEMERCIRAVVMFKQKAADAKVVIAECLPDK
jgi:hypothetical protein